MKHIDIDRSNGVIQNVLNNFNLDAFQTTLHVQEELISIMHPCTETVKEVLIYACLEALKTGKGLVTSDHILLAVLTHESTSTVTILKALQVDPKILYYKIKNQVKENLAVKKYEEVQRLELASSIGEVAEIMKHYLVQNHELKISSIHILIGTIIRYSENMEKDESVEEIINYITRNKNAILHKSRELAED